MSKTRNLLVTAALSAVLLAGAAPLTYAANAAGSDDAQAKTDSGDAGDATPAKTVKHRKHAPPQGSEAAERAKTKELNSQQLHGA